MGTMFIILGSLMVVVLILMATLLIRNDKVYSFRMNILKQLSQAAEDDVRNQRDYEWRFHTYNSVGYNEMVAKFWKPLKVEKWYRDTSFINSNQ